MSDLGPEINKPQASPNASELKKRKATSGSFKPGNKGGPGNPFAAHSAILRAAHYESWTKEDMKIVADNIKKKCLAGNFEWTKFIFEYLLQKPKTEIETTTITLSPEEIQKKMDEIFGIEEEKKEEK